MSRGSKSWHASSGRDRRSDPWGFAAMHAGIQNDMHRMHADMAEGMRMGRGQRAAHLRHMRRMRDFRNGRSPCGPWAYWWLVFPLVFWVLPALERGAWRWDFDFNFDFGFDRAGAAAERVATGWTGSSPVTWIVDLFARATGLSAGEAGAVLLLAALVNGAALVFALRRRAGRG
jgi:hypothetical protein